MCFLKNYSDGQITNFYLMQALPLDPTAGLSSPFRRTNE